jgi:hypothetical protein
MKKLLSILAVAVIMVSCNNKKSEEKSATTDTTVKTTETTTGGDQTTTTTTTTTTNNQGVPSFSDPEVQKFANDYAAFLDEYKKGLKDPARMADLTKSMQDWSSRSQSIGMKLANNPDEAKKWADWIMVVSQEFSKAATEAYKQ